MRYDEIRKVLQQHFEGRLALIKERIGAKGRLQPSYVEALESWATWADQAARANEPLSEIDDDSLLDDLIEKYSLPLTVGSTEYKTFGTEYQKGMRDFARAAISIDSSMAGYRFEGQPQQLSAMPPEVGPPIKEVVNQYLAEGDIGGKWVAKTRSEKTEHFLLLYELLGDDLDFRSFSRSSAQYIKKMLMEYPKNRRKNPLTRDLPLKEAMRVEDVEKLNYQTLNKYIQSYTALFAWAKDNGYADENVFAGMSIAKARGKNPDARDAFTPAQIKLLVDDLLDPDSKIVSKPYQKWGGLIGVYSGARLNEIAQLLVADVRQKEGIWCFDFNDDTEGKHIKTATSKRLVPIHQRLIDAGLLDYVGRLRADSQTKLFPSFTYDPQNGWGRALGRWFNDRFLVKMQLKSRTLVFHSLRHTVVTSLSQQGVQGPIVKAIIGHAQEGVMQQHYFKMGYTLPQLSEAIGKLV